MRGGRLLLLPLLLCWQLAQPGQALAHAALLAAMPEDASTLAVPPEAVRLQFDEPVELIALGLVGPSGAVTPVEAAVVVGSVVSARFAAGLPRGTYLLSWRVVSVDSHVVAGTIAFGVGTVPVRAGPEAADRWIGVVMALRGVFLAALLLAAGGVLFRWVAEPSVAVRAVLAGVAGVGVALAVVQVGVRGAWLAGAPTLLGCEPWVLGVGTTFAASCAVSGAGLAGCAWALRRRRAGWGVVAAVVAVAGLPLSGHAGTAEPRWLMSPAVWVHGLAGAFWIGALWPLLRGGPEGTALRRFSAVAVPVVGVLLLSGGTLAVVQVGHWGALTGSGYGRVLLLKLSLVGGLLGLAGWNRWRLTPAVATGGALGWLRGSIRAELGLAAGVLAVTAVLGLTPPPRVAPVDRADFAVWTQADGIGALVEVTPGRLGFNAVAVTIDRAVPPREVWLELRQSEAGVAAIRRAMRLEGGRWVHAGPEMAVAGRWVLRVEALLGEFEQTTFITEITIP